MKKLLIVLLTLIYSTSFAQIPLAGYITGIGATFNYPTHLDSLGMGGMMCLHDSTSRNAIPLLRRKIGMIVYDSIEDIYWKLTNTINSPIWVKFNSTNISDTTMFNYQFVVGGLSSTGITPPNNGDSIFYLPSSVVIPNKAKIKVVLNGVGILINKIIDTLSIGNYFVNSSTDNTHNSVNLIYTKFQTGQTYTISYGLSTGGNSATNSGSGSMSASEIAYWIVQAALLDPAAYVLYSGTGWSVTVPSGETWFSMGQYNISATGQQQIHQRLSDVGQVIPFTAGTVITPQTSSYLYICRPALVTGSDPRYFSNPKELYYSRLNLLNTLPINYLQISLPSTLATNGSADAAFPTDFTKAMVVGLSVYDASWGGFKYIQGTDTLGTINTQNEINNYHTVRFAQGVKCPFMRTIFPGIRAAAGNFAGTAASTSNGGAFSMSYIKLPNNW